MKKIFITIFSLFCLVFLIPFNKVDAKTTMSNLRVDGGCDSSQFQYDADSLIDCRNITLEGMGANLIDTSNIEVDKEKNILYYNGWINVNDFKNSIYYLNIDGVKPVDQKLFLLVANEDDEDEGFVRFNAGQISLCSDSSCIFGIPGGDDTLQRDEIKYITFIIDGNGTTFDKDVEYYKDKVYLNNSELMPNYYTPYFYDSTCLSYSETRKNGIVENDFVISTSVKMNIDKLKESIKVANTYTVKLLTNEYSENYNKAGKYTISFEVNSGSKTETVNFVATVISLGSITYNKDGEASYTYNVSTNISTLEFKENLPTEMVDDFTFDLSSGIVKKRFVFDDADITGDNQADKINNFQEICKVPGTYTARWELFSNISEERVEASYDITINIVDDSKIEVFVPKFVIYINPEKQYTTEELAKQIKNLLVINNIFDSTSTVSITSNEYEENSTVEGEYTVTYRVVQGNHIYDESCTVNVSVKNSYEPEIVIENSSKFNPSIIYISIIIVLVLGTTTYFVIKKVKNRKK